MNQIEPAFEADLLAGFAGLSFMPKIYTLSHNNAAPVLRLYEEFIEYRGGFRPKKTDHANIKKSMFSQFCPQKVYAFILKIPLEPFMAIFGKIPSALIALRFLSKKVVS